MSQTEERKHDRSGVWGAYRRATNLLKEGEKGELLKGSAGSLVAKVGGTGTAFLVQIILTRHLGAEVYGEYIYVLEWINVLVIVAALGFASSSVKYVAEYHGEGQNQRLKGFLVASLTVPLAASLVITLGLVIGTNVLAGEDSSLRRTMAIGSAILPFLVTTQVTSSHLRGRRRVVLCQVPLMLVRPALVGTTVLVLSQVVGTSLTSEGAIAINLGVTALVAGSVLVLDRRILFKHLSGVPREFYLAEWIQTGLLMAAIGAFNLIIFRSDTILVGVLTGTVSAGIYSVATRVSLLVVFVLGAVITILAPQISEMHKRGDWTRLQEIVKLASRVAALASVGVAAVLLVGAPWILALFGEKFMEGTSILRILILGQLANGLSGPAILLLKMTGFEQAGAKILAVAAVTNIMINVGLIELWGPAGAALGTSLVMVGWNAAAVVLVRKALDLNPLPWGMGGAQ